MEKKELRKYIRERKKLMMPDERLRQSEELCRRLMRHPRWRESKVVLLYHALPDEVDTSMLLESAMSSCPRKKVLLPVVVGDDLELRAYDGNLEEGAFGILEPTAMSTLFTDYASVDLVVVPGMAFDAEGHRLGRGKGYYDKTLCQLPAAYRIGICFDYQKVERVPSEAHDISMHEVI